jgi:hypothetical protein
MTTSIAIVVIGTTAMVAVGITIALIMTGE